MESIQEMQKQKSEGQTIYLKTNFKFNEFYDNGYWKLTIYTGGKKQPKLENLRTNNLELYISFLCACIRNFQEICDLNNLNEFVRKEFVKVIYYYLKEEVAVNRYTSKIQNAIISNYFKIDEFKSLIQEEVKEINSYTYINLHVLDYLNQLLQVKNELSIELIWAIVMCSDYEKIRETNYRILEKNIEGLRPILSNLDYHIKNEISAKKMEIKELRKEYNSVLFKRIAFISGLSLAFIILLKAGMPENIIISGFTSSLFTYIMADKKILKQRKQELLEEISGASHIVSVLKEELNSLSNTLQELKVLYDELIGYESISELELKYQQIIEYYDIISSEYEELSKLFNQDEIHKLIKKYKSSKVK